MQKRMHSREFKLDLMRQITSGQKKSAQLCREYNLHESLLSRWRREYRERGEYTFLPQQFGEETRELLEKKRAWDRNYYQRHKNERQPLIMKGGQDYTSISNKLNQRQVVCIVVKTILPLYNSITATLRKRNLMSVSL